MAVTALVSAAVGLMATWTCWILDRSGGVGRAIQRLLFAALVAAIALPLVLHAAGWEATAGKFGWLPLTQTGSRSSGIGAFGAFGGLTAAAWIHGLVGAALVTLATRLGIQRTGRSVAAAAALDASPLDAWWHIRLPLAIGWTVTALLGSAGLAATEMTVVDLYGYRTVADEFYRYHAADADGAAIAVVCLLPMLVAATAITLLVHLRNRSPASGNDALGPTNPGRPVSSHSVSGRAVSGRAVSGRAVSGRADRSADPSDLEPPSRSLGVLAGCIAVGLAGLLVGLPITGLLVKAGQQVEVEAGRRTTSWSLQTAAESLARAPLTFADEYRWTLILAGLTALAAVSIGWVAAAAGRQLPRTGKLLDLATVILVLIPGPIVGLGVVRLFQWNVPGFRFAYQQTLLPTILGLLVRAAPVAYWVLRAGYRNIDDRILEAARLDAPGWNRWWAIDRPLLGRSIVAALLAAAVVASGDVPVLLPVIPPGVTTVGTRLFELLHNGARNQEASLALWYVAAVVLVAGLWMRWGRRR
jgi:iron(III) transport system permease protein